MTRSLPLSGLVVVELGTSVAAPTAAMIFAELGAEVYKVENPHQGDDARSGGRPLSTVWARSSSPSIATSARSRST